MTRASVPAVGPLTYEEKLRLRRQEERRTYRILAAIQLLATIAVIVASVMHIQMHRQSNAARYQETLQTGQIHWDSHRNAWVGNK